jgi:subtilisin family serine protease
LSHARKSDALPRLPVRGHSDKASSTVPGEILVRFRSESSARNAAIKLTSLSTSGRRIPIHLERFEGAEIVAGLYLARVDPRDTPQAIESLQTLPEVDYAEPNYIWQAMSTTPNDQYFNLQWGLTSIEAEKAWDLTTGSSNVVVGVLDGGVDISHPDLVDNIWTNPGEIPGNGIDDDGDGFVDDVHGWDFQHNDSSIFDNEDGDDHATHVAGIIGARGNNSIGVAGVCWQVSILPIKVLGPNGGSISNIIAGYSYAKTLRDRGVNIRVLNNSYGGPARSQAALDAIQQLNNAGILFVVAAGNEGRNNFNFPQYPANYDVANVIAVAATTQSSGVAGFSNYGASRVALAAPGSGIASTLPNNQYGYADGTSMAAPHVSGAAALVISAKPNISLTALKGALIHSNAASSSGKVKGFLSVYKAILAANENDTTAPGPPGSFHFQPPFPSGSIYAFDWIATGDDGNVGTMSDYDLTFITPTGSRIPLRTIINSDPPGTLQNSINVVNPFRYPNGNVELRAFDNVGNSSTAVVTTSVNIDQGADPYIISLGPNSPLSTGGQRLAFDGDDQYYSYNLPFDVGVNGSGSGVTLSTNGVLHFSSTPPRRSDGINDDIPSSLEYLTGQPMLAGLWDDLVINQTLRPDAGVYVVQPNGDTVIFRWQANTFASGNSANFEIEVRRDGTFVYRYGDGNLALSPVVGLSFGRPDSYFVPSHTHEYWQSGPPLNLDHAQNVTFAKRIPAPTELIQMEREQYQTTEGAGNVTITVTRPLHSLPSLGTFSVNYATRAGSALAGVDYVETTGTLSFSIGENLKTFTVPILNDSVVEPNKTFNVTLTNPTNGSGLGVRNSVAVTIFDDDSFPTKQIQFSTAGYSVDESNGSASITLTRTGDLSGSVSVDYSTSDITAEQRSDYIFAAGTIRFAPGEVSKTFPVLIIDDVYAEPTQEYFGLYLSNPIGTSLGAQNTAVLNIMGFFDPAGATTNPLDDPQFFVREHYYDFLSRIPDRSGFGFWTGLLNQCGTDAACLRSKKIDVSNAFFYELEYQQTGAYVYRLYRAAFGNNQPFPNPIPDPLQPGEEKRVVSYAAFVSDRARVVGGSSLTQAQLDLANAFVMRPEFLTKYPVNLDGPGFVDAVLATINNEVGADLGSQRSALIGLFNSSGRGAVIYRLADDNSQTNPINNRAFIDAEYNRAFVATQYFGYLRRDPDMAGFLFWLGQVSNAPLRDVTRQHAMVCSFITSAEYQQRFSPAVTHSNSECQ